MAAGITRCVRRDYATTCIHRVLQVEEDATIYDEVTEDQYKSIVRGRLAKDDFVVDDGVGGYMDNGMDDFEEKEDDRDPHRFPTFKNHVRDLGRLCESPIRRRIISRTTAENIMAKTESLSESSGSVGRALLAAMAC